MKRTHFYLALTFVNLCLAVVTGAQGFLISTAFFFGIFWEIWL